MNLTHGQTVLIKRRREPEPLPPGALPVERPVRFGQSERSAAQATLFSDPSRTASAAGRLADGSADLDSALRRVIAADFDAAVIGREMLRLSAHPDYGLELSSQFAIAVAASLRARHSG
jgi:hypothetical protein